MTQTIEIKDFTGGENNIVDPFSIYPTEGQRMQNLSVTSVGMKTKNFRLVEQIIPPRIFFPTYQVTHNGIPVVHNGIPVTYQDTVERTDPIQIAPKTGQLYTMSTSNANYYEKVRFYQGNQFIMVDGIPYKLGSDNTKSPTIVEQTLDSLSVQNTSLPIPNVDLTKVVQYTYFVSYRNSAGYESPLEELKVVNAHVTFSSNYTIETASEQEILVTLPANGDYGRVYRMGHNISFPSLVFQFDFEGIIKLNKVDIDFVSSAPAKSSFKFSALDNEVGEFGMTWGGVYPTLAMKNLTATKYGLAASALSQVYLSMNRPDAWSALASLNFGSLVTAITSVHRGFLVFTESTYLYLVSGASLSGLRVDLISTDIGCSSNSSIAEMGEHTIVWIYKSKFYMYNGSSVVELEANTYYFEFFKKYGEDKDITAVSLNNQYIVGTDDGLLVLDGTQQYKPFIRYDLTTAFKTPGFSGLLREFLHNHERVIGVYHEDGSFYRLEEAVYNEVEFIDLFPETEEWGMGCYTNDVTCDVDNTSCLSLGGFGGYNMQEDVPDCADGGLVGLYPEFDGDATLMWYNFKSEYISPKLTFGDVASQATWSSVEILYQGELDVFLYIDDVLVKSKENFQSSNKSVARVLLFKEQSRGVNIEVKLRFLGEVFGLRVNGEPLEQLSK